MSAASASMDTMGERIGDRRGRDILMVLVGVVVGWTVASLPEAPTVKVPAVVKAAPATRAPGWVKRWIIQLAIGVPLGVALLVASFDYKAIHLPFWPDVKPIITLLVACAALLIGAWPDTGAPTQETSFGSFARRSKLAWAAIALGLFGLVDSLPDAIDGLQHLVSGH